MTDISKQAQIIDSPYKLIPSKDIWKCSDEKACVQLRLYGVELIRLYREGLIEADSVKQSIIGINESLQDYGKPVLRLDFLDD